MEELQKIDTAVRFIRDRLTGTPVLGIILGSGLTEGVELASSVEWPFSDIPHIPRARVEGHAGKLSIGMLGGKRTVVLGGRIHFYEGHSPEEVVRPIRLLARLGVETLIVTNAAGAVHPRLDVGDLMLILDHINFMGMNPLRGANLDSIGPRFPDMTEAYDRRLRRLAVESARRRRISLRKGVYAAVAGPSYETPAEVRLLRRLGADAIGMSTVPEVITARHLGLRVLGLSSISNWAAGLAKKPLRHEEVLAIGAKVRLRLRSLLEEIASRL